MKTGKIVVALAVVGCFIGALGGMNSVTAMDNRHQPGPGAVLPIGGKHEPGFGNMSSVKITTPQVNSISKVLNLTADQKTKVQTIITANELIVQPLKQKIAQDYSKIAAAAIILPYDEIAVTSLVTQLGNNVADLAAAEAKADNQIYSILTTEQQALFAKICDFFHGLGE